MSCYIINDDNRFDDFTAKPLSLCTYVIRISSVCLPYPCFIRIYSRSLHVAIVNIYGCRTDTHPCILLYLRSITKSTWYIIYVYLTYCIRAEYAHIETQLYSVCIGERLCMQLVNNGEGRRAVALVWRVSLASSAWPSEAIVVEFKFNSISKWKRHYHYYIKSNCCLLDILSTRKFHHNYFHKLWSANC